MVRLYEYQGKQLLESLGVTVPKGGVASTPQEARSIAEKVGKPVVIKAQVWVTGRFKAGGIKFADNPDEAEKAAESLLGSVIKGQKVEKVLVEERLDIERELYASVIVDSSRTVKGPVLIFSMEGGVDIEELSRERPEKVAKMYIDYLRGIRIYDAINLIKKYGAPSNLLRTLASVLCRIYDAFVKFDARVVETNPLVVTKGGNIVAADCRVTIDDSSVYRHPELGIRVAREFNEPPTVLDALAWTVEENDYRGTAYFKQMVSEIKEPGYIGYHGIGGGGAILGVDALQRVGLKIANYADTSGNPTASKVYRIAKIILSQPGIEGYLLGGFIVANQEQWHHAHAIVKALREELANKPGFPVILLLCGNKEEESLQILREGLKDLPIRLEIYGSEHVYDTDFIAQRMRALVDEYRKDRGVKA